MGPCVRRDDTEDAADFSLKFRGKRPSEKRKRRYLSVIASPLRSAFAISPVW
jgi:hypothetical protein